MAEITLTVSQSEVYTEVAKTTSYTGKKKGDEHYNPVYTTDEDATMLERFWNECKDTACEALKRFLSAEAEDSDGSFTLTLELSSSFDTNLTDSMTRSLFSFFVTGITSRWFKYFNKDESEDYERQAAAALDDVTRKACFKKKPTRPTYS